MLTLICAFSFGAIVRIAVADYHTTCVNHGDQPLSRPRAARGAHRRVRPGHSGLRNGQRLTFDWR